MRILRLAITLGAAVAGSALVGGAASAKDLTVGLSWDTKDTLVQSWEDYAQSEGKKLGEAAGVNIKWVINVANNDPAQQAANIEDLISQGVDVIVARAKDATAIGRVDKSCQRGQYSIHHV